MNCPLLWHKLPEPTCPCFSFTKRIDLSSVVLLPLLSNITNQFRHEKASILGKLGNIIDTEIIEVKCVHFSKGLRIWLKLGMLVTELRKVSVTWFHQYFYRIRLLFKSRQFIGNMFFFNRIFSVQGEQKDLPFIWFLEHKSFSLFHWS